MYNINVDLKLFIRMDMLFKFLRYSLLAVYSSMFQLYTTWIHRFSDKII